MAPPGVSAPSHLGRRRKLNLVGKSDQPLKPTFKGFHYPSSRSSNCFASAARPRDSRAFTVPGGA